MSIISRALSASVLLASSFAVEPSRADDGSPPIGPAEDVTIRDWKHRDGRVFVVGRTDELCRLPCETRLPIGSEVRIELSEVSAPPRVVSVGESPTGRTTILTKPDDRSADAGYVFLGLGVPLVVVGGIEAAVGAGDSTRRADAKVALGVSVATAGVVMIVSAIALLTGNSRHTAVVQRGETR